MVRYSSDADGLSFNRMTYGIGGYDGPLLFVLQNDAGQVFGAFAGERLKESPEFQASDLFAVCVLGVNVVVVVV